MDTFLKLANMILQVIRCFFCGSHPRHKSIAMEYIWARLFFLIPRKRALSSFRVLGKTMTFRNPKTFLYLYGEIFVNGEYISPEIRPKTVLDCGGNIGMSVALFKSMWPDSKITVIEASPEVFPLLEMNARNLEGVTVLNRAVSSHRGPVDFYLSPLDLVASTNAARGGDEKISVQGITLPDLIEGKLDLLKIDIEGGEMDAFRSLEDSGKLALVENLFIEYHHHINGEGQQLGEFLARLERNGFTYDLRCDLPHAWGGFQDILIRARKHSL